LSLARKLRQTDGETDRGAQSRPDLLQTHHWRVQMDLLGGCSSFAAIATALLAIPLVALAIAAAAGMELADVQRLMTKTVTSVAVPVSPQEQSESSIAVSSTALKHKGNKKKKKAAKGGELKESASATDQSPSPAVPAVVITADEIEESPTSRLHFGGHKIDTAPEDASLPHSSLKSPKCVPALNMRYGSATNRSRHTDILHF
jgi:hypothetical protein